MPSRRELANAIRALSMDAVQRANSGHPGAPMGMADIAEVLWRGYLKHNPANPRWFDRDRFVLSNGHASMLLYALLHLTGYDLSIDELKRFRQLGSKTPGHPEYGLTPGVETTTGPLGQGLANAVGMAIAEKHLAARFNRDGHRIVDHYTYVFAGDGCLMEGVSHEACSLAGTLGLGKLIVFYDANGISIDGPVQGWFTEDVAGRFTAYGWQVIGPVDGHDPDAVAAAIETARADSARPSLIVCRTVIGWGSPGKAGTAEVHGAPLGEDEVARVREQIGWPHPPFHIPAEIYQAWSARESGAAAEADWRARFEAYRKAHPDLAAELERRIAGALPEGWAQQAAAFVERCQREGGDMATRKASQQAVQAYAGDLPELIGGSADLTVSNLTHWKGAEALTAEHPEGNYVYYGVREFGMSAIMNGMAVHGGLRPFGGTFLVFSDYARNAVRLAALMEIPVIFVYSHDSIGLGEDGPTHQPVEHLASLRYIPHLDVWRPCDDVETAAAWRAALLRRDGPTALVTSRQGVPHQSRDPQSVAAIERGGYVLLDPPAAPELVILATGSEVALAVEAARCLNDEGRAVRVVSLPCAEVFDRQDAAYRDSVLPPGVPRLAVEAATPDYWRRYVGLEGDVVGLDRFGVSAPAKAAFEHFGFTVDNVMQRARAILGRT